MCLRLGGKVGIRANLVTCQHVPTVDVSKLTVFCVNVFSNEENESQNDTQSDTQNDTQNLSSLQKDILRLISTNNQITGTELAKKLGKSLTTIRRAIRGISFLKYDGPSKGGHWIIEG